MIVLTCTQAREFKTLLSRCSTVRSRGPAPPLVVRIGGSKQIASATTIDGVTVTLTTDGGDDRDAIVILPGTVLAEVEGTTDDPVNVERKTKSQGIVRWNAQGRPRSIPVELIQPGKQHELPDPPVLSPIGREFLTALHECGRGVAREGGRYALSKIQIQGKAGKVIGTDGKVALMWHGFALPFPHQVLVPAIPVFGAKEMARESTVRIGRTASHMVVAIDPWAVWLPIDTTSRYPDVAGVIPRRTDATVAGIDEQDAEALLAELPQLPGASDEHRPVTLDLDGGVKVRAADTSSGEVREIYLARSPVAGPGVRVALDRTALKRLLGLGCHTIRVVEGKPLVAEGENRTVIVATLDSPAVVPPYEGAIRSSTDDPISTSESINPERTTAMKPPLTNGHSSNNQPEPARDEHADTLAAAEELRATLADAATKATRLVSLLKNGRKEKKVLAAVWAGLKQLNLGPAGGRS